MRIPPELGKVSKQALGLIALASVLLCRCVEFAPDLTLATSQGGSSGQSGAAGGGTSGRPADAAAGEAGAAAGDRGDAGSVGDAGSGGEAGDAGSAGSASGGAGAGGGAGGAAGNGGAVEFLSVRPERSLIETNPDALGYFTLERVLERATGELGAYVYKAWVLSFAERSEEQGHPGPRCDDEQLSSDGLSSFNGFSLPCPAEAANLYWQLPAWKPLAVTNRFDLAPAGGENCGEQHLSFFFDTSWGGQPDFPLRAYLSFAAVIANPAPERGLEGCRPLLEFWASLGRAEYDAPDRRARAFELAFLGSTMPGSATPSSRELSALPSSGFQPLVSPLHFGPNGRLQLLYLGDKGGWHFFEHALVSGKEGFVERRPLSQSLAVAALLDEHPKREQCVDELLASIPGLLSEDVNLMRLNVDPACFAATNSTLEPTLSAGLISAPLGEDLRTRLDAYMQHYYPDSGVVSWDIAKRAGFAGTCTGCHALGDTPWSNPSSVSHVNRDFMRACASSGPDATRRCYARSPLLNTIFMPHWASVLDQFLQHPGQYGPLPSGTPSTVAIDGAPLTGRHP